MNAILESKRINLGVVVTAALLALLNQHGIRVDDSTTAALALGLGGLWTAIIYSDSGRQFSEKGILALKSFRASDVGRIVAAAIAWLLMAWQGYTALTTPTPSVSQPAVIVESAENVTQPTPLEPSTDKQEPVTRELIADKPLTEAELIEKLKAKGWQPPSETEEQPLSDAEKRLRELREQE